jgi:hypothetical protein
VSLEVKEDHVYTDNGDSEKVLATVAATIYAFTAEILSIKYPNSV